MNTIEKNLARYLWAEQQASLSYAEKNHNQALVWSSIAANCAWKGHAGFYVSQKLESFLLEIAARHVPHLAACPWQLPTRAHSGKRWLHVMTRAFSVGGHTALAVNFIKRMTASDAVHSVLLTDQRHFSLPEELQSSINAANGSIISLPCKLSFLERAAILRKVAHNWADTVILYVHPNDPVPVAAFGVDGGPPIVYYNHADHVFWLGSSIADLVIELRLSGKDLSLRRRGVRRCEVLPIPLHVEPVISQAQKLAFKRELCVPPATRIMLSIGTSYKYEPYGELDFPRLMATFLKGITDVKLLVVGPSPHDPRWIEANRLSEGKVEAMGVQSNLSNYYGAADLYLESFPVGSLVASLDAVLRGVPIFRAPFPPLPLLCLDRYDGMNTNAGNLNEFFEMLRATLEKVDLEAVGLKQRAAVVELHSGDGWNDNLRRVLCGIPSNHQVDNGLVSQMKPGWMVEDEIWADIQTRHSGHCLKSSVRATYPYLKKIELLRGLRHARRLGERSLGVKSLFECLIDASMVFLPTLTLDYAFKWYMSRNYRKN